MQQVKKTVPKVRWFVLKGQDQLLSAFDALIRHSCKLRFTLHSKRCKQRFEEALAMCMYW